MTPRGVVWSAACLLVLAACDKPQPTAESASESAPRVATPLERVAALQAEVGVISALDAAGAAALREVEGRGEESGRTVPAELDTAATRKFTVFFGANNHGERNDCGCRKNPLGGLGRRHAMLDALSGDAATIWGDAQGAPGPVFHVDAGDALFANNTLDRAAAPTQKVAKYDAESVVKALATFPPDAYLVGEHDLVFGLAHLRTLTDKAGFPLISANLRTKDGELAFAPSVIVERDGVKVAFVGVTLQATRRQEYWSERELTVDEPVAAVKRAVSELGPRDATVVLSNLGLADTGRLVDQLAQDGVKVELAIASGTGRSTEDPDFSAGVPVMEPLSRGKYLGRADIWLNGDATDYRNAAVPTPSTLREYRRAVRSYWGTRKQQLREQLKIAELELSLATLERGQQPDAGPAVDELKKRRTENIESLKKRLATFDARRESTSTALMTAASGIRALGTAPAGDDWIAGYVVPVKIEFTPEPVTRKLLDQREKRRPKDDPRAALPAD